jgi:hypothetical protein
MQHQETLIDYDIPQLFIGYDQFNVKYLCLLIECTEQYDTYLCVPITSVRLKQFYQESLELRKIYENPESDELFHAKITGDIKNIELIPIAHESLLEDWLPEHNFYFKKENMSESNSIPQLSKEQVQDLLDLLKYKPLLELLNKQHKIA